MIASAINLYARAAELLALRLQQILLDEDVEAKKFKKN